MTQGPFHPLPRAPEVVLGTSIVQECTKTEVERRDYSCTKPARQVAPISMPKADVHRLRTGGHPRGRCKQYRNSQSVDKEERLSEVLYEEMTSEGRSKMRPTYCTQEFRSLVNTRCTCVFGKKLT